MNRRRQLVLVLFCFLIVYCCTWVPWHIVSAPANDGASTQVRVGYGWLRAGPQSGNLIAWGQGPLATPDLGVIGLRLLAVAAASGIGFLGTLEMKQ